MKIVERAGRWGKPALAGTALLSGAARAQAPPLENTVKPGDSEIHRLRVADQKDRSWVMGKSQADRNRMTKRDADRLKRAEDIYRSGGLVSAGDYFDFALIMQHSNFSEDYLLAHVLCIVSIAKENTADARWLSAAALDRYLQSVQQTQIFGTQHHGDDKNGYTNDPYHRNLLTDATRTALEVPSIEQQKKDFLTFHNGLPVSQSSR